MDFALGDAKPQLGVEIYIVIPGQPIQGIQRIVRQTHHLGEARVDRVYFVDHPLCSHNRDIADDLHRSVIDPCKALPCARGGSQREGTACHLRIADEDMDCRR